MDGDKQKGRKAYLWPKAQPTPLSQADPEKAEQHQKCYHRHHHKHQAECKNSLQIEVMRPAPDTIEATSRIAVTGKNILEACKTRPPRKLVGNCGQDARHDTVTTIAHP